MSTIQYFSDEYLAESAKATPAQVLQYLEQFRLMQASTVTSSSASKLISLKVPEDLLGLFRARCDLEGIKYQTQIKSLMKAWLERA